MGRAIPTGTSIVALLAIAVVGCDNSSREEHDAGPDSLPGDAHIAEPESPALPALPELTPCPAGWREVPPGESGSAGVTCSPWPVAGRPECGPAEAHFPGGPGCEPVGSPCPEGEWPEELPDESLVLYVHADAEPGGDGTLGAPLDSIGEAIELAAEGTVIALSTGSFDEAVRLDAGTILWGTCAAETIIRAPDSAEESTVAVGRLGQDTVLRNVTITGPRVGIAVQSGELSLEGVVVDEAEGLGILVQRGGELTAEGLVVRRTQSTPDGYFGRGLNLEDQGVGIIARALFDSNREIGVAAFTGASVTLSDAAVVDTLHEEATGWAGSGISIEEGGHGAVSRTIVSGSRAIAVVSRWPDSTLTLTDVVIADTAGEQASGLRGRGLSCTQEGQVTAERVLLEDNHEAGLVVLDPGSLLTATDVVVRHTSPEASTLLFGYGAIVAEGGELTANGLLLEQSWEAGLAVYDSDSTANIEDLAIFDVESGETVEHYGIGVHVTRGSRLALARAHIERAVGGGVVLVHPETRADIEDLTVRDIASMVAEGTSGNGFICSWGATASVARALIEGSREVGVFAGGIGSELDAVDLVVLDTQPQECAESTCEEQGSGVGIGAYAAARIAVTNFVVAGNAMCGVQVAYAHGPDGITYTEGGELDLSNGLVTNNPIGANVQVAGFDIDRLTENVVYRDNVRNLVSEVLPVPDVDVYEP